jgi:hypothetical protein
MEEHLWEKAKLKRSCSHFGDDEKVKLKRSCSCFGDDERGGGMEVPRKGKKQMEASKEERGVRM